MTPPAGGYQLRPVDRGDPAVLVALLEVYRQSEDFLALGPQPFASPEMVLADLDASQTLGSLYCGIYASPSDELIGVVDYLPSGFEGAPQHAFLELLMIAQPYRRHGLGNQIVASLEAEIRKDPQVSAIRTAVQVNNPAGLSFWQRCGYRIIRQAEMQPDQTITYLMEKQI